MKSKSTMFQELNQYVKIILQYNFGLFVFGLIFSYKLFLIAHAENNIISAEKIEYYLKLVMNDYYVFRKTPFTLPDEFYQGWCDPLTNMPKQRYDSYCIDPEVIKNHVAGVKPAIECCNF
jgi:hypothetical protein